MKIFLLLCLILFYTVNSISCDCFPVGSPLEELKESDAVFIGTVRSVELLFLYDYSIGRNYWANRVIFRVTGYWKGVTSPDIELYTPAYGPACGYFFKTGQTYLVYAYIWQGELNTNSCTRTREITYAEGDVEELGDPEIFVLVDERSAGLGIPDYYCLHQNIPNPTNPTSKIAFELPKTSHVTLSVYNTLGQQVATLVDEQKQPGRYKVQFDGSKLTSGVYFYRIVAGEFTQTKQMLLVK